MNQNSISVTHDALLAYEKIESAERYVVLHAAFYPKYLADKNEHQSSIEKALSKNEHLQVYIIFFNTELSALWAKEFACVLRTEFKDNFEDLESFINQNVTSAKLLQKKYPNRVHLYKSHALPLIPIIMADDTMFVGHYAHSDIHAPLGFWFKLKYDYLSDLFEDKLNCTSFMDNLNEEQKAILRYVDELVYGIKSENTVKLL